MQVSDGVYQDLGLVVHTGGVVPDECRVVGDLVVGVLQALRRLVGGASAVYLSIGWVKTTTGPLLQFDYDVCVLPGRRFTSQDHVDT